MYRLSCLLAILAVLTACPLTRAQEFRRGDVNGDGTLRATADAQYLLHYLVNGGGAPPCLDAADVDDDGNLSIGDLGLLLQHSFPGGGTSVPIPAPGPLVCGLDPTPDSLDCVLYDCGPTPPLLPSAEFVLGIDDAMGGTGAQVAPLVRLSLPGTTEAAGWSFGVCHDPSLLQVIDVSNGRDWGTVNPQFEVRDVVAGAGWTVAASVDSFGFFGINPGANFALYQPTYELLAIGSTSLTFCPSVGAPPVDVIVTPINGTPILPTQNAGTVVIGAFPPPNDECASASVVVNAEASFTLSSATTDGPDLAGSCDFGTAGDDRVHNDVWYLYTATCSGDATFTVEASGIDTRVAVYDDAQCPPAAAGVLGCDDDALGVGGGSEVTVAVVAGTTYKIQVGSAAPAAVTGGGTLTLVCNGTPPPNGFFEIQSLFSPDPDLEDDFGVTVGKSQDVIVVGAPSDDEAAFNSGAVYVYRRSGGTWLFEQKLLSTAPRASQRFGQSVAVSGDVLVAGSAGNANDPLKGGAHVYRYNGSTWLEEVVLVGEPGSPGGTFGASVALDQDLLVVGAFNEQGAVFATGVAYVFRGAPGTWTFEALLEPSDGVVGDQFGFSVDVDGDAIVVSSATADLGRGKAYAFSFETGVWAETGVLEASDGAQVDLFGISVAISGNLIVAGAFLDDDACNNDPDCNSGSVYVFRRSAGVWSEDAKITASDAQADDVFGSSVDILGNRIIASAVSESTAGAGAGSVYVYEFDGLDWTSEQKFQGVLTAAGDDLGVSVELDGALAVVGAWRSDLSGTDTGSVLLFDCNCVLLGLEFRRGDANNDGMFNIADPVHLLNHLFPGSSSPALLVCTDAADANDDGVVNIGDGVSMLGALFGMTVPLPAPYGVCGEDASPFDVLGCSSSACP